MTLESAIRKAIYEFDLLDGCEHLGVALSGGKDSLTLLHHLHKLSGHGFSPFKLTAFHVSGAFSCGPSVTGGFLQGICDALKIPLVRLYHRTRPEKARVLQLLAHTPQAHL